MPLTAGLSYSRNKPDQPVKTKRDRVLDQGEDPDNVPRPDNEWELVQPHILFHREHKAPEGKVERINSNPSNYWNEFYKTHESSFFKDRQWLGLEFPDLMTLVGDKEATRDYRLLEVGCGAGNALFPLVESNSNPRLHLHGSDYSEQAVEVVKNNAMYSNPPCGKVSASVWDLSDPSAENLPVEENSCDYILMIFVMSALHPDQFSTAINNVYKLLKPGGKILFRDYGRYDLAQIRMKKERLLQENFYCRGDGTRVYFFELDELNRLFNDHGFTTEKSESDRRLLINRKEEKKMYRVWQQAIYTNVV
ncbi:methyltransferase [Wallemia mellicola]|nr:methyltransferase [Wallemia mellicola]